MPTKQRRSPLVLGVILLATLWALPVPARATALPHDDPAVPRAVQPARASNVTLGIATTSLVGALAAVDGTRDRWSSEGVDATDLQAARDAVADHLAAIAARVSAARAAAAPPPPQPAAAAAPTAAAAPATPRYVGRNHMWFPALGYDRSIAFFPCSSTAYPANVVYRWGCAGANNVYLFGHAWGVMKPLHDAYVAGRLKVGMKVVYADPSGVVHAYAITTWRLLRPEDSAWPMAAQSVPSMTLQTCVGANSEYRLVVRLVRVS